MVGIRLHEIDIALAEGLAFLEGTCWRFASPRIAASASWIGSMPASRFLRSYKNPDQIGFSDLRLLNDDQVKGGGGFATHEHKDTEVFSYVLDGALEHKDSMGYGSVVRPGEVLTMSAGTGITHSEFNHSKTEGVHFLQIWMDVQSEGRRRRATDQKHFADAEKRGQAAADHLARRRDGSTAVLSGHACLRRALRRRRTGRADARRRTATRTSTSSAARVSLNGTQLNDGDGARVRHEDALAFTERTGRRSARVRPAADGDCRRSEGVHSLKQASVPGN